MILKDSVRINLNRMYCTYYLFILLNIIVAVSGRKIGSSDDTIQIVLGKLFFFIVHFSFSIHPHPKDPFSCYCYCFPKKEKKYG